MGICSYALRVNTYEERYMKEEFIHGTDITSEMQREKPCEMNG
jgi:hypothetical protein